MRIKPIRCLELRYKNEEELYGSVIPTYFESYLERYIANHRARELRGEGRPAVYFQHPRFKNWWLVGILTEKAAERLNVVSCQEKQK